MTEPESAAAQALDEDDTAAMAGRLANPATIAARLVADRKAATAADPERAAPSILRPVGARPVMKTKTEREAEDAARQETQEATAKAEADEADAKAKAEADAALAERKAREERGARAKLYEAFFMRGYSLRGDFSFGSDDVRRLDMAEELLLSTLADNAEPDEGKS